MKALQQVRPAAWGLLGFAGLALLLGLGGQGLRTERERLTRVLTQERALRADLEAVRREQEWLDRRLTRPLDDPQILLDMYAPGSRAVVRSTDPVPLSDRYRSRQTVLELDGLSWDTVHTVIEAFEAQNPPWRLTGIDLRSGLAGLEGRLTFDGLEPLE